MNEYYMNEYYVGNQRMEKSIDVFQSRDETAMVANTIANYGSCFAL